MSNTQNSSGKLPEPVSAASTNYGAFATLVSVFFFWGFVAASNDILIPVFKEKLNLSQAQAQMVSFAFYIAYTVGSLIYTFISKSSGGDILNKIGYRNGISLGLIISALGTLLFIPAANSESFILFISGLFIVGLGFSLQQTAANPLAIVMGDHHQASNRLSLAGGINNFGTTIGPLIVNLAIFGTVAGATVGSLSSVKTPYLILGALFVIAALVFRFSSVPNKIDLEAVPEADEMDQELAMVDDKVEHKKHKFIDRGSPLKYPQLVMGMIAIFVYVGVEVSTASNLPEFMKVHLNVETSSIAPFVSLFWASLMIGRWTSASGALTNNESTRSLLRIIMPFIAFGVFLLVNIIAKHSVSQFFIYIPAIIVLIIADFMSKGNPATQLLIFSILGIAALLVGIFSPNPELSKFAFISVGLFCSTLWPCIFTLAIAGLGKHTNEGSSLLIMMIMGGGIVSLLQGWLGSPNLLGIQNSYYVGVACFLYLAFYAYKVSGILKQQGISYDKPVKGGH